ncbi:sulfur carrier protein ThiS adenylyltransferase [Phycisphaerales bacterium]|nr:sulfur carrier protein ThiS adenylyltransferase [Phycisphaerales bacterium]
MANPSRYSRQLLLPGIGAQGQARLAEAHAVIVGVGALGCASADLLARAGVGDITLIDRDVVETSNLQRQTLFDDSDATNGLPKAAAAARRLSAVNPTITVRSVIADLTPRNAESLLLASARPGIVLDGTDNFETRYLLNDVCVKHGVALAYGGVIAARGMQATFLPGEACLRCVFDDPPTPGSQPTCDTAGVLGSVVAIVGACQATDAIKILTGNIAAVGRTILDFDAWTNHRRRLQMPARRANCACCGGRVFEYLDRAGSDEVSLCGRDAVQVTPRNTVGLDLESLAKRLAPLGIVRVSPFMVRAAIEGMELTVFEDGRAIVKGTTKPEVARGIYSRFIGD